MKKQLIDQSAHFFVAILLLAPLIAYPSIFTALFAGLGYGFVREITEEGNPVTLPKVKKALSSANSRLDIAFWGFGGAVAYLIFG